MADKILTEDDVRQIARDEANYAIGKHREQYHEANGLDAESVARTVGVTVPGERAKPRWALGENMSGVSSLWLDEKFVGSLVVDHASEIVAAMNAREDAGRFGDPEQLQVQLAGCSVAALGGTQDPAVRGKYGWSPPYQDVLDLRLKYEALLESSKRAAVEALRAAADNFGSQYASTSLLLCNFVQEELNRLADRVERGEKP